MALLDHLLLGFSAALSLQNLAFCFLGCLLGTLVGVLPGLGPLSTIAMLLPVTFGLDPLPALIMLAGIYYGAQYGGSTTAILVALPGETSSVVTIIDGYQMARQGRAGAALATAALASFFAGCVGTLFLAAFAVPLSQFAIRFGSPEFFSLMVVGLVAAAAMGSSSTIKAVGMIIIGVLLGLVGGDITSGIPRFVVARPLLDGIDFVVVAIGVFAFTEVIDSVANTEERDAYTGKVVNLWPTRDDFRRIWPAVLRGTGLGMAVGILPGAGPSIASFGAYAIERQVSKEPGRFGKGAVEGVAAPEAANNAAAQCAFVPTLTLGIPSGGSMALMLGAMTIHNIQPGPQVVSNNPELFWGLVASMWIGNLMLLILNLPLVGIWVKLLKVPSRMIYPAILAFCCIGVYSVNNSIFDLYLTVFFGAAGYLLRKLRLEPAPMILGFVLGPIMEENFRRSMLLARGDFSIFVTRPISATLLAVGVVLIAFLAFPSLKRRRNALLVPED